MFSQASVILSTIGLMDTRSLLIHVTARPVRILLECFLVSNNIYLLEVISHFKLVLLAGNIGLHFRVGIVDDSQEHVQQHEEHEEDVQDEVHRTQNTICSLKLMEVEISQYDTEQREARIEHCIIYYNISLRSLVYNDRNRVNIPKY